MKVSAKPTSKQTARKPILVFLLSFFLPVLIMLIIFAAKGIYPFGDNSFLRTDMYHQYAPFFSEFLDKLQNGGSLLYSWDIGGGTNFLTLFAYYLASPFNWLLLLCPKAYLIEFMSYLIIIKIGLCGLAFSWYLSKRSDSRSPAIALAACCYALSAYLAAYSWNIMWLDCIILAPIILLGLEHLVKEDKCLLYCLSLGLCILSNYYISIMVCLFLVLYFIVQMIILPTHTVRVHTGLDGSMIKDKTRTKYGKKIFNFCLYSLIAGGLAAVLLIPEMKALGLTAAGTTTFPKSLSSYFSIFDMLARHCVNVTCEIGLEHWPNIYCGTAVMFLFPLYIMDKNVNFKEKAAGGALLVLMLLSFNLNIPNFVWHGFHYPNSLPCRQSFLYIAVLLAMCWDALKDLRRFSTRQIVTSFWVAAVFLLLCEKLVDVDDFQFYNYYITFALVGLFALFAYLYKTGKAARGTVLVLAFSLLSMELGMNTAVTSVTLTSRSAYLEHYDDYQVLIEQADAQEDTFFRMEKDDSTRKTKDDGAYLNYHSGSVFSSLANANLTSLYKKFGFEGSTNAYGFMGATPVSSSLLGVKYFFSTDTGLEQGGIYEVSGDSNGLILYKNPYAQGLGYLIPENNWRNVYGLNGNPVEYQNQFVRAITGVSDVFTTIWGSTTGSGYNCTVNQSGHIYIYVTNSSISKVTANIGGETKTFSNVKRGYILDMGCCSSGTTIQLTNSDEEGGSISAIVYRLNEDAYIKAMSQLQEHALIIDSYDDTHVTGHITAEEAGTLLVTIPYEEGWTVWVDGVEIEPEAFQDAYYAIPLEAGTHSIQFRYIPAGFKPGALISLGSLLLLLAVSLLTWQIARHKKAKKAAPAQTAPARALTPPFRNASPSAAEGEIDHVITIDDLPRGDDTPQGDDLPREDDTPQAAETPGNDE